MEEKIIARINGEEVECNILFTFDCEDTNKSYVGYTDNKINENGKKNIYVSSFDPLFGTGTLEEVKTEEEWEMINDVIKEIESGN